MIDIAHVRHGSKQAYEVILGRLVLYFSYSSPVGASYNNRVVRCPNKWGPTTGRHMHLMGLYDSRVVEVTEEQLNKFVEDAIRDMGMALVHRAMVQEA